MRDTPTCHVLVDHAQHLGNIGSKVDAFRIRLLIRNLQKKKLEKINNTIWLIQMEAWQAILLCLKTHKHCPLWFTRVPVVTCHVCCFVLSGSSYHGYMIILTRINNIVCFFVTLEGSPLLRKSGIFFRPGKGTETLHQFATWIFCRLFAHYTWLY